MVCGAGIAFDALRFAAYDLGYQVQGAGCTGVPHLQENAGVPHLQENPRTLPWAYAQGPRGVLGGWALFDGRGTPLAFTVYCLRITVWGAGCSI